MGDGSEQISKDPFESLDIPRKSEFTVSKLRSRFLAKIKEYTEGGKRGGWSHSDIRDELKAESDYGDLSTRNPIQIAQGEQPILAVNDEQTEALKVLFGYEPTGRIPYYALVQVTGRQDPETIEAGIKIVQSLRPLTENHFVISAGLANRLNANAQNEVRIISVYRKPEDINLDAI